MRLTVKDDGAAYPLTIDPWVQTAKVPPSDGAPGDAFNTSVVISGN